MAANYVDVTRKLVIVYTDGTDTSGKAITKTRTFAGLSETADAAAIQTVAEHIGNIMGKTVDRTYVRDTNEVLENE